VNKSLKIILICLVSAAIIFGAVVGISHLPRRVQQDFSGIELLMTSEDEYENLQTTNVRIDGRVRYGMFSSYPRFEGIIEVSAYEFTLNGVQLNIHFLSGFSNGGGMSYPLLERIGGSSVARIESLGLLYTDKNFSSLVIHITEWTDLGEGSAHGQQGNRVIVAPANDTGTALEVLRSHNFLWSNDFGLVHRP